MTTPPVRLVNDPELTDDERALLDDMSRPPIHYDVSRGAVRFRATLAALGAAGVATTLAHGASASGMRALFGKVGLKLAVWVAVPAVGAGVAASALVGERGEPSAAAPAIERRVGGAVEGVAPASAAARAEERESASAPAAQEDVGARSSEAEPVQESERAARSVRGREASRRPSRRADAPPDRRTAAAAPAPVLVELEETEEPAPAPAADRERTAATDRERTAAADRERTAAAPAKAPELPAPSDTIQEMQAIARAKALLPSDPAAALAALEAVRHAHPRGFFVEERRALTVFALARSGNMTAARAQAASFLKQYPDGPFSDKVRAVAGR